MSRKLHILTGVAIMASTLVAGTADASALNDDKNLLLLNLQKPSWVLPLEKPEPSNVVKVEAPAKPPEPKPVEPVKYTVAAGDNLSRIADAHSTSWLRLWNKNTDLSDPDLIYPGQVFLIPDPSEQLLDRPVPVKVIEQMAPAAAAAPAPGIKRAPVPGNTYSAGYCTWYVKNRRPDLPNNLGNANTWYARAEAQGYAVGATPRAGAVGTTTRGELGHVVFVESVNADGSIMISEMNYRGLYSQRTRPAAASEFKYIY